MPNILSSNTITPYFNIALKGQIKRISLLICQLIQAHVSRKSDAYPLQSLWKLKSWFQGTCGEGISVLQCHKCKAKMKKLWINYNYVLYMHL